MKDETLPETVEQKPITSTVTFQAEFDPSIHTSIRSALGTEALEKKLMNCAMTSIKAV